MRKLEDVVIRMQQSFNQIEWLFPKSLDFETWQHQRADVPFSDAVVEYLNALSQTLLRDPKSRVFPDVVTFAFFCRKANVLKMKEQYATSELRLGRGLLFHIAPSNVPINFAYSLVAGLLAGNYNVVRVSSKQFPQVDLVVRHIGALANDYPEVSGRIVIVRYEHTSNANAIFSAACHVRVIWGGDRTIATLRESPIPARSFDICFADRYSMAALNADALIHEENMPKLAEKFYNDTYLFDQNACSAPHLIVWTGSAENIARAKDLFWGAVHRYASTHYANFQDVMAVDKLTAMYKQAVVMDAHDEGYETNVLRRVELSSLPENIDDFRCAGGYFTEYSVEGSGVEGRELDSIAPIIKNKYQTLAYYGFDCETLTDFVLRNRIVGIDRIVPLGETTAFSLTWDGYNLINQMSRIVSVS